MSREVAMRFRLVVDGEAREIEVERNARGIVIRMDNASYRTRARSLGDSAEIRIGTKTYRVRLRGNEAILDDGVHPIRVAEVSEEVARAKQGSRLRAGAIVEVRPSMPGRVVRVAVNRGDVVRRGQTLVVLEAMKMQNEIASPGDGVVRGVGVAEGETVTADRVVVSVELRGPSAR